VTGFVVDPFDLDRHAAYLLELVENPEARVKMGRAARARIESEFSYEMFRERHRTLLRRWFPASDPSPAGQSSA
jgi:glycosyltransferase involved in cell wall biosynthesis